MKTIVVLVLAVVLVACTADDRPNPPAGVDGEYLLLWDSESGCLVPELPERLKISSGMATWVGRCGHIAQAEAYGVADAVAIDPAGLPACTTEMVLWTDGLVINGHNLEGEVTVDLDHGRCSAVLSVSARPISN